MNEAVSSLTDCKQAFPHSTALCCNRVQSSRHRFWGHLSASAALNLLLLSSLCSNPSLVPQKYQQNPARPDCRVDPPHNTSTPFSLPHTMQELVRRSKYNLRHLTDQAEFFVV